MTQSAFDELKKLLDTKPSMAIRKAEFKACYQIDITDMPDEEAERVIAAYEQTMKEHPTMGADIRVLAEKLMVAFGTSLAPLARRGATTKTIDMVATSAVITFMHEVEAKVRTGFISQVLHGLVVTANMVGEKDDE